MPVRRIVRFGIQSHCHRVDQGTNMCIVTPIERRSLTRMTLLITSLPRSSKTRTFQIGFPSASRMGATGAKSPLACASSASLDSMVSLRLRIFLRDAIGCGIISDCHHPHRDNYACLPIWRSRRETALDAMTWLKLELAYAKMYVSGQRCKAVKDSLATPQL